MSSHLKKTRIIQQHVETEVEIEVEAGAAAEDVAEAVAEVGAEAEVREDRCSRNDATSLLEKQVAKLTNSVQFYRYFSAFSSIINAVWVKGFTCFMCF